MEKTQKHMMNHKYGNQSHKNHEKYTYESIQQLRTDLDNAVVNLSYSNFSFRRTAKFYFIRLTDCLEIIGNEQILLCNKFKFIYKIIEGTKILIEELKIRWELEKKCLKSKK